MDQTHQGAAPSPRRSSSLERKYKESNLSHLYVRTLALIFDIEQMIEKPHMIDTLHFLDRFSTNIVSLFSEATNTNNKTNPPLYENRILIRNILNCPIHLPYRKLEISLLDAATVYRKNKENKEVLIALCESMLKNKIYTRRIIS